MQRRDCQCLLICREPYYHWIYQASLADLLCQALCAASIRCRITCDIDWDLEAGQNGAFASSADAEIDSLVPGHLVTSPVHGLCWSGMVYEVSHASPLTFFRDDCKGSLIIGGRRLHVAQQSLDQHRLNGCQDDHTRPKLAVLIDDIANIIF